MVKVVLAGVWATVVALGAFYGALMFRSGEKPKMEAAALFGKLEQVKTDVISVPMLNNGKVEGYVLARFAYLVDADLLKKLAVRPDPILMDSAFRTIYASPISDFQRIEKYDLKKLTARLKRAVNDTLGAEVVRDVLIDSINYVARDEIRFRGLRQ